MADKLTEAKQTDRWTLLHALRFHGLASAIRSELGRAALSNTAIFIAGTALAFILNIILARALGPADFGRYATASAAIVVLALPASAGVPNLLTREVAAATALRHATIVRAAVVWGVRVAVMASAAVVSFGAALLLIFGMMLDAESFALATLVLFILPIVVLGQVIAGALRGLQRLVVAQVVERLLRPAIAVVLVAALFWIMPELRRPSLALAVDLVGALVTLVVGVFALRWALPTKAGLASGVTPPLNLWRRSLVPFLVLGSASMIKSQSDILMLGLLAGSEAVGLYRVAAQGAQIVTIGLFIINTVTPPHFARLYALGKLRDLKKLAQHSTQAMFGIAILIAIVLVLFGKQLLGLTFGTAYAPAYIPLLILAFGYLVHTACGSVGFLLAMSGHEANSARLFGQSALLNVLLNAALIPLAGVTGAALATMISHSVWVLRMSAEVQRQLGIRSSFYGGRHGQIS